MLDHCHLEKQLPLEICSTCVASVLFAATLAWWGNYNVHSHRQDTVHDAIMWGALFNLARSGLIR